MYIYHNYVIIIDIKTSCTFVRAKSRTGKKPLEKNSSVSLC